jgi:hypothetical protein
MRWGRFTIIALLLYAVSPRETPHGPSLSGTFESQALAIPAFETGLHTFSNPSNKSRVFAETTHERFAMAQTEKSGELPSFDRAGVRGAFVLTRIDLKVLENLLRQPPPRGHLSRESRIFKALREKFQVGNPVVTSLASVWLLAHGPDASRNRRTQDLMQTFIWENPANVSGYSVYMGSLNGAQAAWYPPWSPQKLPRSYVRRQQIQALPSFRGWWDLLLRREAVMKEDQVHIFRYSPRIVLDNYFVVGCYEIIRDLLRGYAKVPRHIPFRINGAFVNNLDLFQTFGGLLLAERLWFHESTHVSAPQILNERQSQEERVMHGEGYFLEASNALFGYQRDYKDPRNTLTTIEYNMHLLRDNSWRYPDISAASRYRVLRRERLHPGVTSIADWIRSVYDRVEIFGMKTAGEIPAARRSA